MVYSNDSKSLRAADLRQVFGSLYGYKSRPFELRGDVFFFLILVRTNVLIAWGKRGSADTLWGHKKQVGLNQFLRSS